MNLTATIAVATGALVLMALPAHARDCSDIRGDWTTNINATMRFETIDSATGMISGLYIPASDPDMSFPLTGFINPNGKDDSKAHYAVPISVTVSFGEFGGITNWSGTCSTADGKPVIETEDLIIFPMADYYWSHVVDNHDKLVPKD